MYDHLRRLITCAACLAAVNWLGLPAGGAEWGDLVGRFVFDGPIPVAKKITPDKDAQFCSKDGLFDESLVVSKDGGVANVIVYLRGSADEVPVHPDLAAKAPAEVKFDNKGCRFEPRVLPVWVGKQTALLHNSDPIGHNMNIQPFRNQGVNYLLPGDGGATDYKFEVEENLPVTVTCNIHSWMKGYLVARETPYVAVSDANGNFKIEKLPAGEWTFQTWHEKSGYLNTPEWGKRGRFTMTIKPGKNDLGTVKLPASLFEK